MTEFILLFVAGFVGGMMNTVAGGGTFVTFPALVLYGIPEVSANATATLSALPGYLAGALGFRREVQRFDRRLLVRLTLWTLLGSAIGSGLLLVSSNAAFRILVPFLLLVATLVFMFGEQVRDYAARHSRGVTAFGAGTLLPVAIYGGYFNGGLGIVLLALFALWGMRDLHEMNGLKTWLSFALSVISAVIFTVGGKIVWVPALVMMAGNTAGGYLGAPVARRLPRSVLRGLIAVIGFGMTTLFFRRLFL
ncbi:sulfite exporter TauE/SafE family protein [Paracoccus suum]|uniref:Probable membrane transporter protein n=1 Tax=Paracoccus suum TaxID=2259340 RepID=A0A344PLW4_9RHOB|nr:sulfite exporter TauE/SafE family protein [Paracoccus suum]AXC50369.1 sulfite exporter TauE/SafE family protein [Paracoccus suum]